MFDWTFNVAHLLTILAGAGAVVSSLARMRTVLEHLERRMERQEESLCRLQELVTKVEAAHDSVGRRLDRIEAEL